MTGAATESCRVLEHADAGPDCRRLCLAAPRIGAAVQPGQFVHVRVPGLERSALRRPFSVFGGGDGELEILYKIVGRGTAALAHVAVGETIDVLGPLGYGFPVSCGGVPLLVGGGFGVAPLHFLAKRMRAAGLAPVLFVGGRTAGDLLALDRFAALGVEVRMATNDGSAGVKGFVTDPLDDALIELRTAGKTFELFACGPDGMLKAVAQRATGTGMKGWISMDRHMVCGVGACYACIQRLKRPDGTVWNARCCVNGPVFKASELVWD